MDSGSPAARRSANSVSDPHNFFVCVAPTSLSSSTVQASPPDQTGPETALPHNTVRTKLDRSSVAGEALAARPLVACRAPCHSSRIRSSTRSTPGSGCAASGGRSRRRARRGVGRDRGARVRCGLADGRLGAQPGRRRDRASKRRARRRASSARCPTSRRADVVGSPYCIRDYEVAAELGGDEGLAAAREALERCGLKLILDFVPNHVAPDHPWTAAHPEYFVRGSDDDVQRDPARSCASETASWRTAGTPTSPRGPTSCS